MRKLLTIAVVAVFGLTAAACEDKYQTAGTVVGAAAGAAVGSQIGSGTGRTVAMIAGAAIGAYLGNRLGRELDRRDRAYAEQNAINAMEKTNTGTSSSWQNPDSGNKGEITPTSDQYTRAGRECRDFEETIELSDGRTDTVHGTRCRRADGSWEVVEVT